jgi:hypothetical protein
MRLGLTFSLLVAIASITANGAATAQTFQGKLWIVTPAEASAVTLPPSAQEDVDFATNGIAYIGQGPDRNCLSIGRFLKVQHADCASWCEKWTEVHGISESQSRLQRSDCVQ